MRPTAAPRLACLLTASILAGGVSAAESWIETRAEIEELAAADNSEAAIAVGDAYVDSVREEFGESSAEHTESLLLLADAQMAIGAPGEAAESIGAAIVHLETSDDTKPTRLIDAWVALGEAHLANDLDALAIDAWENAIGLSRRELGLSNEEQVGIRWLQSQAALAAGDREAANRYRDESRNIAYRSRREAVDGIGRQHGTDSREYVDAMLAHARWLASEHAWAEARVVYSEILETLDQAQHRDAELIVRTLQEVASTIGFPSSTYGSIGPIVGTTGPLSSAAGPATSVRPPELERARSMLNRMQSPDPALEAAVLRDWADWELNLDRMTQARRRYRQVLALLEKVEGGEELAREWFDGPILLQQPWLSPFLVALYPVAPNAPTGNVEAMVSVDRNGWVRDVRVLSADPAWMTVFVERQLRNSRYRPRIVDGEPVASESRVTWTFRYDPMVGERAGLTDGSGVPPGTEPQNPVSGP